MNNNFLFTTLALVLSFTSFTTSTAQNQKPNIVVIMADDIGLGDLSYYHENRTGENAVIDTPNLDKLVKKGMRFDDAHAPHSLCAPTRYAMMTGNFMFRNRSHQWGVWSAWAKDGIDEKWSVANIAKKGGYTTAFFGKWGLGGLFDNRDEKDYSLYTQTNGREKELGFDYSVVLPNGIQSKPFLFFENTKWMPISSSSKIGLVTQKQTKYKKGEKQGANRAGVGDTNWDPSIAGPILADKAISYIKRQQNSKKPFYLYYCSQAVHIPHTPSKKINGVKIAGTTPDKHGDMIKELDQQVGMIIAALKETGKYENTLFIFTSDNGGLGGYYAPEMKALGHNSSNGLRGHKGSIYEGGHRVPFIAVWPGKIKPNSKSNVAIYGQDIVATVAEIAGVDTSESPIVDASNLLPAFKGEKAPLHKYMMHQSQAGGGPYYAFRDGDLKVIFKTQGREKWATIKPIGLYDMKQNKNELKGKNLMNQPKYKKQIKEMTKQFLKIHKEENLKTVF